MMQKITHIQPKMFNGSLALIELDLQKVQTTIMAASITHAKLVICDTKELAQKLVRDAYQMMTEPPAGVQFELAGNVSNYEFDFTQPPAPGQKMWLRYPDKWQPVRIKTHTGVLFYCLLEGRAGSVKNKIQVEITLTIGE